jgi:ribosomal protein S18 acetylase RimI-like enzyme
MLSFHKIHTVSDPFFRPLFNLYTQAFPQSECRTWAGIELELDTENRFNAHALLINNEFVGLLNYWIFDRFLYIEHFAISADLRGQHIGREAMNMLMEQTKLPIVFEVEMPVNPMAIRRIRFYERLKFSVLSHHYAQPPYDGEGFIMPMLIMSNNVHFANTHFELIKDTLFEEVYQYSPIKSP